MTKTKIALFAIPALAAVLIGAMMLPAYSLEAKLEAQDTTVRVAMDIKPGSCPNPINTTQEGLVSVAILGTETFDVRKINTESLELTGVKAVQVEYEDVSSPYTGEFSGEKDQCTEGKLDEYVDLTMRYSTQDLVGAISTNKEYTIDQKVVTLKMTGELNPDAKGTIIPIVGEDVIELHDVPDTDSIGKPPIKVKEPPIIIKPPRKVIKQ